MNLNLYVEEYAINQEVTIAQKGFLEQLLRYSTICRHSQPLDMMLLENECNKLASAGTLAALRFFGEYGIENNVCFAAYPVHLGLMRDSFQLEQILALSLKEMGDLTIFFNQFFAQDGLRFIPSASGRFWYLSTQSHWDVVADHVNEVLGKDVMRHQAMGRDASKIRVLQNQLQMLLHEHPVNFVREQAHQMVCNGVWISGGIELPVSLATQSDGFIGDDALIVALSKLSGTPVAPMTSFANLLRERQQQITLYVNSATQLEILEEVWNGLKSGQTKSLNLFIQQTNETMHALVTPLNLWKFWRKHRPLENYWHA